jgi:DNA-binding transcriptional ArsR family regulator
MNKKTSEMNYCIGENKYNIFFTNLANPLKVKIILLLRVKEMNVTDLTKALKVEQSKISHALKSLRNCKIVNLKQQGKERIYSLNKQTIVPMLNLIDKHATINCKDKCCCAEIK